jgi:RNA recognition motif-containing protein
MTKLFVGNIPHSSDEQQIAAWVEGFGFPVEAAEIIRDRVTGNPRGFGFVRLKNSHRVSEAIQLVNGQRMGERIITVGEAVPLDSGGNGAAARARTS